MEKNVCALILMLAVEGLSFTALSQTVLGSPVTGPLTSQELQQLTALDPIDTHIHIFQRSPEFYSMLKKLNLHTLDILVIDGTAPPMNDIAWERKGAWDVAQSSGGRIALCTSFDPYKVGQPGFTKEAIRQINQDFSNGAVAVKIWKNIGMEIKDAKGKYIMPDDPAFEPIYKDIAAHNKTLIAHLAEPSSSWEAPNPASPDYDYYQSNQQWYMYSKPNAASKQQILKARDHVLEQNPNLRMVGAHLGSMEADFKQLGDHFDRYPNFAVDMAARMPYLMLKPRADMIAFVTKYQDRLIYGTDTELVPQEPIQKQMSEWEESYALDWRYLATSDIVDYEGRKMQGLGLPQSVLYKIYHENAVHWFPGILENSQGTITSAR